MSNSSGTRVQPQVKIPRDEKWWERVPRMIGGWGLVFFSLKWIVVPIIVAPERGSLWVTALFLAFSVALIGLGSGIAHSTVFKIVADTGGKFVTVSADAIRSVRYRDRRGKNGDAEDTGQRARLSDNSIMKPDV